MLDPQLRIHLAVLKASLVFLVMTSSVRVLAQESSEKQDVPTAGTEPSGSTGTVQGSVMAAATGEPLPGSHVMLTQASGRQPLSFGATTDSEGHFLIAEVPAGRYRFQATKNGYVTQAYRPETGGADTILELTAGQKLDKVQFSLRRAAAIVGRITDENGEPMSGVTVVAVVAKTNLHDHPYGISIGGSAAKAADTNDLGEYRIFGLRAGSYNVAAIDSGLAEFGDGSSRVFVEGTLADPSTRRPPIYYPGVSQRSQAQEIRLGAGQEARVDMSLRPEKTVTVSGWVADSTGKPATQATVSMRAQSPDETLTLQFPVMTDAQGKFEIKGVTPGSYVLSATSYQKEGKSYSAEQSIEVAGENVARVRLQLYGSVNVTGKLTVSGGASVDLSQAWVYLSRSGGEGVSTSAIKDGAISFRDLYPGTYTLALGNLPDGWYVSSAVFGSDNVLESGLKIGEGANRHVLEVVIRLGTVKIEGVVTKGEDPVSGARVKLALETENPYRQVLDQTTTADQRGHFVLENVVPGRYRALAVKGQNDSDDDDDFPEDTSAGTSIVVAEGESKAVRLKVTTREP